ncbi:MAG: tetratricopeptide repeat protein [Raineya sp.]|jgi:tetratricopeptide (TPR) repeat protein|nr:tetratricopeptide repeat protein [Raineya sp.]
MNNKIILLLFLSCSFSNIYAQKYTENHELELDSLNKLLNQNIADTTKINVWLGFFKHYYSKNPQKASEYNEKIFQLLEKIDYPQGFVWYNENKGKVFCAEGKYKEAKDYYQEALLLAEKHLPTHKSQILYNLGAAHYKLEEYVQAMDCYTQSLKALDKNLKLSALITQALGALYLKQKDYEQAHDYFDKSIEIHKKFNTCPRYAYNGIGMVFFHKKDYNKAMEYLRISLKLSEKKEDIQLKASLLNSIGAVYHMQKDLDSATVYYNQSAEIYNTLRNQTGARASSLNLASAYIDKGKYKEAEKITEKSLAIIKEVGTMSEKKVAYCNLAQLHKNQNQYKEAFEYLEKEKQITDSIENFQAHKNILEVHHNYQNHQKDQKTTEQLQNLQKAKEVSILSVILLVTTLIGSIIISILFLKRKQLNAKKQHALMELEQMLFKEEQMQIQMELSQTKQQLEHRDKELTTFNLSMIQKDEHLNELKQQLEEIIKNLEDKKVVQPLRKLKQNISVGQAHKHWENFKFSFEQVHKSFFTRLTQKYTDITPNDLKLAALLRLNFSSKEIASFIGISEDSVKKARYRLRKKLNLEQDDNLVSFLMKVEDTY